MIITLDLHTHLNEKNVNPKDYWKRVKEIQLDAVAITEHNSCDPKLAFEKLNKTKPEDVVLIPGIELNTSAGHAIVYAVDESLYEEIEFLEDKADIERVMEIVKKKGFYLSFAHPFGYENDSLCFLVGTEKAKKIIKKNHTGVEIYNGLISHLSNFLYDSEWVKRPFNFLSFLEGNFVARKTGLGKLGGKLKKSFDSKREDILMRCIKAIELGNEAEFITVGSDAHSADRIGTGIMKLKFEKELNVKNILEALKEKEKIIWTGPLIIEKEAGVYEKIEEPLKRKEIVQGLNYITQKAVKKGKDKVPTGKIKNKIKENLREKVVKRVKNAKIGSRIKGIKNRVKK